MFDQMSFDQLNEVITTSADEGKIAAMKARDDKDFHLLDIAIKYFDDISDAADQLEESRRELDFN